MEEIVVIDSASTSAADQAGGGVNDTSSILRLQTGIRAVSGVTPLLDNCLRVLYYPCGITRRFQVPALVAFTLVHFVLEAVFVGVALQLGQNDLWRAFPNLLYGFLLVGAIFSVWCVQSLEMLGGVVDMARRPDEAAGDVPDPRLRARLYKVQHRILTITASCCLILFILGLVLWIARIPVEIVYRGWTWVVTFGLGAVIGWPVGVAIAGIVGTVYATVIILTMSQLKYTSLFLRWLPRHAPQSSRASRKALEAAPCDTANPVSTPALHSHPRIDQRCDHHRELEWLNQPCPVIHSRMYELDDAEHKLKPLPVLSPASRPAGLLHRRAPLENATSPASPSMGDGGAIAEQAALRRANPLHPHTHTNASYVLPSASSEPTIDRDLLSTLASRNPGGDLLAIPKSEPVLNAACRHYRALQRSLRPTSANWQWLICMALFFFAATTLVLLIMLFIAKVSNGVIVALVILAPALGILILFPTLLLNERCGASFSGSVYVWEGYTPSERLFLLVYMTSVGHTLSFPLFGLAVNRKMIMQLGTAPLVTAAISLATVAKDWLEAAIVSSAK